MGNAELFSGSHGPQLRKITSCPAHSNIGFQVKVEVARVDVPTMYPMLRNITSGTEIGLPGQISAGFSSGELKIGPGPI